MPKANVDVKTNIDEGVEMAKELSGEIPKGLDDAALKIAKAWKNQAGRVMFRQGNVVTGEGVRSLQERSTGERKAGVFGAPHLQLLETGTPPHYPDTANLRFIAAARQYGMAREQLALAIAQKGTDAYPWMDQTTDKIRRKARRKTSIELDRAIDRSK